MNTVSLHATNTNAKRPKFAFHYFKKLDFTEIYMASRKDRKNKLKTLKIFRETKTVAP